MDIFALMALAKANQGGGGDTPSTAPYNLILRYSYIDPNGFPQDLALDSSTSYADIVTAITEKHGINAYLVDEQGYVTQIAVGSAFGEDAGIGIICTFGKIAIRIDWDGQDASSPSSASIYTYNYLDGGWCTIHISESGGAFSYVSTDGIFAIVSKTRIVCDTSNNSLGVDEIQLTGYRTWLVGKTRHTIYTASVIAGSPAVLKEIVIEWVGTTHTVTVTDHALS